MFWLCPCHMTFRLILIFILIFLNLNILLRLQFFFHQFFKIFSSTCYRSFFSLSIEIFLHSIFLYLSIWTIIFGIFNRRFSIRVIVMWLIVFLFHRFDRLLIHLLSIFELSRWLSTCKWSLVPFLMFFIHINALIFFDWMQIKWIFSRFLGHTFNIAWGNLFILEVYIFIWIILFLIVFWHIVHIYILLFFLIFQEWISYIFQIIFEIIIRILINYFFFVIILRTTLLNPLILRVWLLVKIRLRLRNRRIHIIMWSILRIAAICRYWCRLSLIKVLHAFKERGIIEAILHEMIEHWIGILILRYKLIYLL